MGAATAGATIAGMFDPEVYISTHFTWARAACHDGTPVPPELRPNATRLAWQLEIVRAAWGGPIIEVSWYRSPAYNEGLRQIAIQQNRIPGQAKDTQHTTAGAIDCAPVEHARLPAFHECIKDLLARGKLSEIGGRGIYPGWVHLDIRAKPPNGHIAFWVGDGFGSEMAANLRMAA